jgi:hypothetical protein
MGSSTSSSNEHVRDSGEGAPKISPEPTRLRHPLDPGGVAAIREGETQISAASGKLPDGEKLLALYKQTKPADSQRDGETPGKSVKDTVGWDRIKSRLDNMKDLANPAKTEQLAKAICSGDLKEIDRALKGMTGQEFKDTTGALVTAFKGSGIVLAPDAIAKSAQYPEGGGELVLYKELPEGESSEGMGLTTVAGEKPFGIKVTHTDHGYALSKHLNPRLDPKPEDVGKDLARTIVDTLATPVAWDRIKSRLDNMKDLANPAKTKDLAKALVYGNINEIDRALKGMTGQEFKESTDALLKAFKGSGIVLGPDAIAKSAQYPKGGGELGLYPELPEGESGEGVILTTVAGEKPRGMKVTHTDHGYALSRHLNPKLDPKPEDVGQDLSRTIVQRIK